MSRPSVAFTLSPDIDGLLGGLRSFVESEILRRHDQHRDLLDDPRERYGPDGLFRPAVLELIREVRSAASKAGYYQMFVPEALGGGGLGYEALYRVWEDLYHHFGAKPWLMASAVAHWARGPSHVLAHASEQACQRALPGLLSGETSMCFAMSEPDAGSDARQMRTRAVPDRDGWTIHGSKIWVTNGPYADYAVVFARVEDAGITAFLVATDTAGFRAEGSIRMFGEIGSDEAVLHFDGVHVGADMVLGEVGGGFAIAMSGVATGRVYNSARAVGLARWALERGLAYAKGREAFGSPIAAHQGVAFPLAESATEIHAAHLVGLNCALLLDQGGRAAKELSMAKAFSTEAAVRAIDRVIQAHGAIGFTNELGLSDAYHAVRKALVADGTSEILRRAIAERLFRGDIDL
jgi:alkylation response protein AidB-like acyl-CoA dehydrogenase